MAIWSFVSGDRDDGNLVAPEPSDALPSTAESPTQLSMSMFAPTGFAPQTDVEASTMRGEALLKMATQLDNLVQRLRGVPLGKELQGIAVRLREEAEAEDLWVETEELRLQLEALRAADYRDRIRAACAPRIEGRAGKTEQYQLDDGVPELVEDQDDLAAMYEFQAFSTPSKCSAASAGDASAGPPPAELYATSTVQALDSLERSAVETNALKRRLRLVEAHYKEREAALQAELATRDKKLAAASRALQRTKAHNQQLTAQASLKDLQQNRGEVQVDQLRKLLVEKERRLQSALDDAAAQHCLLRAAEADAAAARAFAAAAAAAAGKMLAIPVQSESTPISLPVSLTDVSGETACQDYGTSAAARADATQTELPHETTYVNEPCAVTTSDVLSIAPLALAVPPVPYVAAGTVAPAWEAERLQELTSVMEELTGALADCREELTATNLLLQAEQALRELRERDLTRAHELLEARNIELAELRRADAELRAIKERSLRVDLEDRLQRAMASRGSRRTVYHPHFEV